MAKIKLSNEKIAIEVDTKGAELTLLYDKESGKNFMWSGDAKYWGRISPVLFPFVGQCREKQYRYGKTTYSMGQHGFARDMEFQTEEKTEDTLWFCLSSTEETKKKYPFDFLLHIGYRIEAKKVTVMWKVDNKSEKDMYFAIGGHPAFYCPPDENMQKSECFIGFDNKGNINCTKISELGLAKKETYVLPSKDGILPVADNLFDQDALVIERDQAHQVSLMDKDKKPYLTVKFNVPLFGIWSPSKEAPFICIEPWYGRCDGEDFEGTLEEREWNNCLKKGESFQAEYEIIVE